MRHEVTEQRDAHPPARAYQLSRQSLNVDIYYFRRAQEAKIGKEPRHSLTVLTKAVSMNREQCAFFVQDGQPDVSRRHH